MSAESATAAKQSSTGDHAVYLIAATAVALRLTVAIASGFTNEDAYISLRYAEHIALGQGFCYNVGQHVLGTTTPLYTLILAFFDLLHLPALSLGKLANILADGLLCVVAADWARALFTCAIGPPEFHKSANEFSDRISRTSSVIVALIIALNPIHIRWAISGMETSLVTLCGAVVWLRFTQARYLHAFVAMGVLFLLRWDSVLMMAALMAGTIWRIRRVPWRELTLYVTIILPWIVFAARYFGSPIPVTAAAKMAVYGWRASHDLTWIGRHMPQLGNVVRLYFGDPGRALFSVAAGAGFVYAIKVRLNSLLWPVTWFTVYWCAFLYSRVLLFPWYAAPPLPAYELIAAIGFAVILSVAPARLANNRLRAIGIAVIGVLFVPVGVAVAGSCRNFQMTEGAQSREIGLWLKSHSSTGDSVMLEPIGYIGYYSQLTVVDVVGLVTPWATRAYSGNSRSPMRDIALNAKPEWCVLRPGELNYILDADRLDPAGPRWDRLYRVEKVFSLARSGKDPIVFTVFKRRLPMSANNGTVQVRKSLTLGACSRNTSKL